MQTLIGNTNQKHTFATQTLSSVSPHSAHTILSVRFSLSVAHRKTNGFSLGHAAPSLLHDRAQCNFIYGINLTHFEPNGLPTQTDTRAAPERFPSAVPSSISASAIPPCRGEMAEDFQIHLSPTSPGAWNPLESARILIQSTKRKH